MTDNHFRQCGTYTAGGPFGDVCSVHATPHVNGLGHNPHLRIQFQGGLVLEVDQATAVTLARMITDAVTPTAHTETTIGNRGA